MGMTPSDSIRDPDHAPSFEEALEALIVSSFANQTGVIMKTDAIDPDGIGTDSLEIEPTTIFDVLSHEHRQYTLQYLAHRAAAVPLGDVAEYIAVREDNTTRDQYERILTGLYHLHLPHLIDAGVITYDNDQKTVQLLVEDDLDPYLRLLPADS